MRADSQASRQIPDRVILVVVFFGRSTETKGELRAGTSRGPVLYAEGGKGSGRSLTERQQSHPSAPRAGLPPPPRDSRREVVQSAPPRLVNSCWLAVQFDSRIDGVSPVRSRGMGQINVVCATSARPNPGMASVDLGFHALGHLDEICAGDAVVFWGDFMHMAHYQDD